MLKPPFLHTTDVSTRFHFIINLFLLNNSLDIFSFDVRSWQNYWVFATNSNFLIPISLLSVKDYTILVKGIHSLGCNDIEFNKSEFVANAQFHYSVNDLFKCLRSKHFRTRNLIVSISWDIKTIKLKITLKVIKDLSTCNKI